jgi:hypothetical protein
MTLEPRAIEEGRVTADVRHESSELLASALEAAGCPDLAARARRDEWNDYFAPDHLAPQHALLAELDRRARRERHVVRLALREIILDVKHGRFDATKREADLWAKSEEAIVAMRQLAGRR